MGATPPDNSPSVVYILRSYPRLSQTFILNEIRALERLGVGIRMFAITDPREPVRQPEVAEVRAPAQYLDSLGTWWSRLWAHFSLVIRSPRRYVETLLHTVGSKESDTGYRVASRYRCFHYAVNLAVALRRQERSERVTIGHLHAHFAHDPTLIAHLAHLLTGIPFSFTAHARDLYQSSEVGLRVRAEQATMIVTCCRANVDFLQRVLPQRLHGKITLIHHGVELHEFRPREPDGDQAGPPMLLSVGRLVEKKGFADLLRACHRLKESGRRFRCRIYGDGPERSRLLRMLEQLDLGDCVAMAGPRPRREIVHAYREADVFALTPFVTEDGDRDGIPNVILEALASGLPVVTTTAGGISEVVAPGVNGLVVQPRDIDGIAASVATLLDDAALRRRLGSAGRKTVQERFDVRHSAHELAALFGVAREAERCVA
jgi:glycosyltransferase involved in cell wall biosynthesis